MMFIERFWERELRPVRSSAPWHSGAWVAASLLVVSGAHAHIELLEPASRYGRSENKSCPCGEGGSNRSCDVERDGSDPNRSENVTVLTAASTITLRFREYIDHSGRFRVAFDPDGADHDDFNRFILLDVPDPDDQTTNIGERGMWELQVQLPDVSCENCTLQLIQAMHGDERNPVADPAELSTYYTCADIVLEGGQPMEGFLAEQRALEEAEQAAAVRDAGGGVEPGAQENSRSSGDGCSVGAMTRAPLQGLVAVASLGIGAMLRRRRSRRPNDRAAE